MLNIIGYITSLRNSLFHNPPPNDHMNKTLTNEGRKYYKGYDVLKFIFAILIVAAHTRLFIEIPVLHYYFSILCSCAIPSFFAVSSYLFIKKLDQVQDKNDANKVLYKTIKRLICIFCIWYLIMFPMAYARFWETATLKESIYALLFSCSFNGYWFFKALIVNTFILFLCRRNKATLLLSIVALAIYLFWAYNYQYHYVKWSISPYYSFYYHIFPSCLGALYARKEWLSKYSESILAILFVLCLILASIKVLNPVGRILYPVVLLPLFSKLQFRSLSSETCQKFRQWSILFYVMQFVLIWIYDMAYTNYLIDGTLLYNFFDFSIVRFVFILMLLYVLSNIFLHLENTKRFGYLKYIH